MKISLTESSFFTRLQVLFVVLPLSGFVVSILLINAVLEDRCIMYYILEQLVGFLCFVDIYRLEISQGTTNHIS